MSADNATESVHELDGTSADNDQSRGKAQNEEQTRDDAEVAMTWNQPWPPPGIPPLEILLPVQTG